MNYIYRDAKLSPRSIEKLGLVNKIIEEYSGNGYVLTLRQLYYQLVSRDIIPNLQAEYGKLSHLMKEARMGGLTDWDSIEDRLRRPQIPYYVLGINDAINDTINQYRLNRMKYQALYIEVWIEKDALSSVFLRVTQKYHIRLMVNRGYSSVSAMYKAAQRINENPCAILYFGDHDPSGLDMVRDIKDRLYEFDCYPDVKHMAITKEHIEEFNPPPNPAKITDPRAESYISKFGNESWELDALPPNVLEDIVMKGILDLIDEDLYNKMLLQEKKDIKNLELIINKIK